MMFQTPPTGEDYARLLRVIAEGVSVDRHRDLLQWLRGDMQRYLPHDILLAGWGDFQLGAVQHDLVSALPGVRSYAPGTDGLPFLLSKLYECWVAAGRKPCHVAFAPLSHLLGSSSLPGSFCGAMRAMRRVVVHGLSDQRGRHECLYVLLSAAENSDASTADSMNVLMPCIDIAFRQVAHLPQQYRQTPVSMPTPVRAVQEDTTGLSERETQIMAWVAMGKTNSEIGTILHISGYTVKNHMQRIFQKLNVFNRTQAVSKVTRVAIDG